MKSEKPIIFAMGEIPDWLSEALCKKLTEYIGKKVDTDGYIGRTLLQVHGIEEDAAILRAWLKPGNLRFSFSLADVYDDAMCSNIGTWGSKWEHDWNDYVIKEEINENEYIVYDNTIRMKYDNRIYNTWIGLKSDRYDDFCEPKLCESAEYIGKSESQWPLLKIKTKNVTVWNELKVFEEKRSKK